MYPNYTGNKETKQVTDKEKSQIIFRKKLVSAKNEQLKEVDDFNTRQRGFRKEWFHYVVNKLRDCPGIDDIVARHHVTIGGLKEYCQEIAKVSNSSGRDPIYLKRFTIAFNLKCSVRTVARYRAAAVEAGLHTSGSQIVYTETGNDNGVSFKGGPTCFYLLKPWWSKIVQTVKNGYDHAKQRIEEKRLETAEALKQVEARIIPSPTAGKIQHQTDYKSRIAEIKQTLYDTR